MKKRLIILLLPLLMIIFSSRVFANQTQVVVFVADGIDLFEIQATNPTYIDKSISNGASALLTTKTAGSLTSRNNYLTLGSGGQARTSRYGYLSFNWQEKYLATLARDIYLRRSGTRVNKGIVNIETAFLEQYNKRSQYSTQIGYLGTEIKKNNLNLAVLGNSDILGQKRRHIALLGIDNKGFINQGDIGQQMSLKSDQYPSGYLTNKDYLIQKFIEKKEDNDLLIIESGDTSRLEAVKELMEADKFKAEKKQAINRVDKLLGKVYNSLDFNSDYLFVITPTPTAASIGRGNRLGFITVVGPGMKGQLSSTTTRRKALVSNLDLAPAIINILKSSGDEIEPFSASLSTNDNISFLLELKELTKKTFSWRPFLIRGFIFLQIILLFLTYLYFVYDKDILKNISKYYSLSLLWMPNFFLLSRFFIKYNLIIFIVITVVISLLLVRLSLYFKTNLITLIIPTLLFSSLLSIDLIFNLNLIKTSVLGYSPVIAARFYGIGNEYMGFLIGAAVMLFFLVLEIFVDKELIKANSLVYYYIFFACGLILILGHPFLGANFGGLVTMSFVFAITLFYILDYKLNFRNLIKLVSLSLIIIIAVLLFDFLGSQAGSSHIGKALLDIRRGGTDQFLLIISRKLAMNLKLFRWTIWTRVLIAFIIFLLIALKKPDKRINSLIVTYPNLSKGFYALLLGSIFTILINDSGVVASATLLFYPIFIMVYLFLAVRT